MLISVCGKTFPVLLAYVAFLLAKPSQWWFKNTVVSLGGAKCNQLKMGGKNSFNVPVWGDGPGALTIGSQNGLGFTLVARFGIEQILLQARRPDDETLIGNRNVFRSIGSIARETIPTGEDCRIDEQGTILDSDFSRN